eukprot:sb/3475296/
MARKLPTNYNEVTFTWFTVFTIDVIIISFLAVNFTTGHTGETGAVEPLFRIPEVVALITTFSSYLILSMLFLQKVWIIYFKPGQNKIHNFPESPTIKMKRYRKESTRLAPDLVKIPSSGAGLLGLSPI